MIQRKKLSHALTIKFVTYSIHEFLNTMMWLSISVNFFSTAIDFCQVLVLFQYTSMAFLLWYEALTIDTPFMISVDFIWYVVLNTFTICVPFDSFSKSSTISLPARRTTYGSKYMLLQLIPRPFFGYLSTKLQHRWASRLISVKVGDWSSEFGSDSKVAFGMVDDEGHSGTSLNSLVFFCWF